ncbi:Cell differentiation protein RCD1 -like protein [Capsicum baccatum]|uniref:Cell differentiation protein RCD1-like protein n=1 Tax=Capsicum baccatum TaxID=33114 RepID=A0A2G2VHN0_CAPBA|nr:Cell differentiation protein RCD1 -like protein [Capsicum baccatum]
MIISTGNDQADDTEVIRALLSLGIIPSCLRSMDIGCELSKTFCASPKHVATFILQKLLLDDVGLYYICTTAVHFFGVARALGNMVGELVEQPSSRLLKYIIRYYLHLSDNQRARDALRTCLLDILRDTTFSSCLSEDRVMRMWLQELLQKVDGNQVLAAEASDASVDQLVFDLRNPNLHENSLLELSKVSAAASVKRWFYNSVFTKIGVAKIKHRDRRMQLAEWLVFDLRNPDFRENALVELSKKRELFHDLAPVLWNSFGTTTILLQEIISIYPFLSPPNLTPAQSNRVCNVLALLQCVASHSDTKMLLLNAKIPLYLYPFLDTTSESRPVEYLRLTSLGVIGALVKGCVTSTTAELFFAVVRVLGNMVSALAEQPSSSLLKHIIRCYLCLYDNPRACDVLRTRLPDILRDTTFSSCLSLTDLRAVNVSTEKLARVAVRPRLYNYLRRDSAILDEKVLTPLENDQVTAIVVD